MKNFFSKLFCYFGLHTFYLVETLFVEGDDIAYNKSNCKSCTFHTYECSCGARIGRYR
jgi:hypothetical protein